MSKSKENKREREKGETVKGKMTETGQNTSHKMDEYQKSRDPGNREGERGLEKKETGKSNQENLKQILKTSIEKNSGKTHAYSEKEKPDHKSHLGHELKNSQESIKKPSTEDNSLISSKEEIHSLKLTKAELRRDIERSREVKELIKKRERNEAKETKKSHTNFKDELKKQDVNIRDDNSWGSDLSSDYEAPPKALENWDMPQFEKIDGIEILREIGIPYEDEDTLEQAWKNTEETKEAIQIVHIMNTVESQSPEKEENVDQVGEKPSGKVPDSEQGERSEPLHPVVGVFYLKSAEQISKPLEKLNLDAKTKENLLLVTAGEGKALVTKAFGRGQPEGNPALIRGPHKPNWTTGTNLPKGDLWWADEKTSTWIRISDGARAPMGKIGEYSTTMEKRGEYGVAFGSKAGMDHFRELVTNRPYVVWRPSESQTMTRDEARLFKLSQAILRCPEHVPGEAGEMLKELFSVQGAAMILAMTFFGRTLVGQTLGSIFGAKAAMEAGTAVSLAIDAETNVELNASAAMFGRAITMGITAMGIAGFIKGLQNQILRAKELTRNAVFEHIDGKTGGFTPTGKQRFERAQTERITPETQTQPRIVQPRAEQPRVQQPDVRVREPGTTRDLPIITDPGARGSGRTQRRTASMGQGATPRQQQEARAVRSPVIRDVREAARAAEGNLHITKRYGESGVPKRIPRYSDGIVAKLGDTQQAQNHFHEIFRKAGFSNEDMTSWLSRLETKARSMGLDPRNAERAIQSHIATEAGLIQHLKNSNGLTWTQVRNELDVISPSGGSAIESIVQLDEVARLTKYWNKAKIDNPGIAGTPRGVNLLKELGRLARQEAESNIRGMLDTWDRGGLRYLSSE